MATIDTTAWDQIYPLSIRRLIENCHDSKILGDILRRIAGQQVDLDEHTVALMHVLMTPSAKEVEHRRKDTERKRAWREREARKASQTSAESNKRRRREAIQKGIEALQEGLDD